MAQKVKNLTAMQETQEIQVRSLGHEYRLEQEMATHSSILVWKNPMDRGAWSATVHGVAELDRTEKLLFLSLFIYLTYCFHDSSIL